MVSPATSTKYLKKKHNESYTVSSRKQNRGNTSQIISCRQHYPEAQTEDGTMKIQNSSPRGADANILNKIPANIQKDTSWRRDVQHPWLSEEFKWSPGEIQLHT